MKRMLGKDGNVGSENGRLVSKSRWVGVSLVANFAWSEDASGCVRRVKKKSVGLKIFRWVEKSSRSLIILGRFLSVFSVAEPTNRFKVAM